MGEVNAAAVALKMSIFAVENSSPTETAAVVEEEGEKGGGLIRRESVPSDIACGEEDRPRLVIRPDPPLLEQIARDLIQCCIGLPESRMRRDSRLYFPRNLTL